MNEEEEPERASMIIDAASHRPRAFVALTDGLLNTLEDQATSQTTWHSQTLGVSSRARAPRGCTRQLT